MNYKQFHPVQLLLLEYVRTWEQRWTAPAFSPEGAEV